MLETRRVKQLASFLAVAVLCRPGMGADKPEALSQCENIYKASVAKIEAQHQARTAEALTCYGDSLRETKADLEKAGNYDGTVAITKELARFEKEKTIPENLSVLIPAEVAEKVTEARNSIKESDVAKQKSLLDLARKYRAALDRLMRQLLHQKKMAEAGEVNKEIEKVDAQIGFLTAALSKKTMQPRQPDRVAPSVPDGPAHRIMLRTKLMGVKKTHHKPTKSVLRYRKHTARTMTIKISIRNLLNTEDTVKVAWFFMGRRVDEPDRSIFGKGGKKVTIKPKQTEELQATSSAAVIKQDPFFSNIPSAEGWRSLDDYVVIVEADGKVLQRDFSSRALKDFAETLSTEGIDFTD